MNLIVSFAGNLDCLSIYSTANAYISIPTEDKLRILNGDYKDILIDANGLIELTFYDVHQINENNSHVNLPDDFFETHEIHFLTLNSAELEDWELEPIPVHAAFENAHTHTQFPCVMPDLNNYVDARFVVHETNCVPAETFDFLIEGMDPSIDPFLQFPLEHTHNQYASGLIHHQCFDRFSNNNLHIVFHELVECVVDNPEERNDFNIYPYYFTESEFIVVKITFAE